MTDPIFFFLVIFLLGHTYVRWHARDQGREGGPRAVRRATGGKRRR